MDFKDSEFLREGGVGNVYLGVVYIYMINKVCCGCVLGNNLE